MPQDSDFIPVIGKYYQQARRMDSINGMRDLLVAGAALLLASGACTAVFMAQAHRTRDPDLIAHVLHSARLVSAAMAGLALVGLFLSPNPGLIAICLCLGALWGLVCLNQHRLAGMAGLCARKNRPLPDAYDRRTAIVFAALGAVSAAALALLWLAR